MSDPLDLQTNFFIVNSPPNRRSLWIQGLPPLIRGIDHLPTPLQRRRKKPPSVPSYFVVHSPPHPSPQHLPYSITMVQPSPLPPLVLLPYMVGLNLPNLSKPINDPISHDPAWPTMETNLPSYIPKFEKQATRDPGNHAMSFHLLMFASSGDIVGAL